MKWSAKVEAQRGRWHAQGRVANDQEPFPHVPHTSYTHLALPRQRLAFSEAEWKDPQTSEFKEHSDSFPSFKAS